MGKQYYDEPKYDLWKEGGHTFILYDKKTNTKKPKSILIKKDKI